MIYRVLKKNMYSEGINNSLRVHIYQDLIVICITCIISISVINSSVISHTTYNLSIFD